MRNKTAIYIFCSYLYIIGCNAQVPANRAHCQNPAFDKQVASWLRFTVPTISPTTLKGLNNTVILDAREENEYKVSHIPNARFIGYKHFNQNTIMDIPKDQIVVVYCSIGYRSERIGEKLLKMGYTKVYNLYGSIFEWVNEGNTVVDNQGAPTNKVHTYNKTWSQWVDKEKAEKVW